MTTHIKVNRKRYLIITMLVLFMILFLLVRGNFYDSVFGVLGWVKNVSGKHVNIEELYSNESTPPDHSLWNKLLSDNISQDGWVNYEGFQKDTLRLSEYLNELSVHPPSHSWTQEEELAYWINAYNAFTIQLILDHYPLRSIKDVGGSLPMINSPWDIKFFSIGNVMMDLNTIEHDILRSKIGDPRIHFAINCASISCPELRHEAYTADKIFAQLEEQANLFINDTSRNKVSAELLELSPIFNWFRSDFEKEQSLTQYVNQYSETEVSPKAKIKWLDYNWSLNEQD